MGKNSEVLLKVRVDDKDAAKLKGVFATARNEEQGAVRAARDAARARRRVLDDLAAHEWRRGQVSARQYAGFLDQRIAAERQYTARWLALVRERDRVRDREEKRAARPGPLAQAVLTSRFSAGPAGEAQPLVGRTAAALGLSGNAAALGAGVAGAAAVVGTAVAAQAARGVALAGDLEQALHMTQHAAKATDAQLADLAKTARDLGADAKLPATSSLDAANAMLNLSRAGLSVKDTMDGARGSLQLAAAANVSAGEAAEITASQLKAFGLAGSEASRVADLLAASANASLGEITDTAQAAQQASAAFALANRPIEEMVAAITALANAGIRGSDAGTSLRTMVMRLISPTDEARELMQRLGIEVTDARGRLKPLADVVAEFERATAGATDAQKAQIFETVAGQDALRALSILVKQGEQGFRDYARQVGEQGAAAKAAEARTRGFKGAVDGLKSAWDSLLEENAAPALNFLADLARGATNGVNAFRDLKKEAQDFLKNLPPGLKIPIEFVTKWTLDPAGRVLINLIPGGAAVASTVEGLRSLGAYRKRGEGQGRQRLVLPGATPADGAKPGAPAKPPKMFFTLDQARGRTAGGPAVTDPARLARIAARTYGDSLPHVVAAGHEIETRFGLHDIGGRRSAASSRDKHGHPAGRALDVMVPTTPGGKAQGDAVAKWALENKDRLGVRYVIWQQNINHGDGKGWRKMADRGSPTANHMDHPHIAFEAKPGARGGKRTPEEFDAILTADEREKARKAAAREREKQERDAERVRREREAAAKKREQDRLKAETVRRERLQAGGEWSLRGALEGMGDAPDAGAVAKLRAQAVDLMRRLFKADKAAAEAAFNERVAQDPANRAAAAAQLAADNEAAQRTYLDRSKAIREGVAAAERRLADAAEKAAKDAEDEAERRRETRQKSAEALAEYLRLEEVRLRHEADLAEASGDVARMRRAEADLLDNRLRQLYARYESDLAAGDPNAEARYDAGAVEAGAQYDAGNRRVEAVEDARRTIDLTDEERYPRATFEEQVGESLDASREQLRRFAAEAEYVLAGAFERGLLEGPKGFLDQLWEEFKRMLVRMAAAGAAAKVGKAIFGDLLADASGALRQAPGVGGFAGAGIMPGDQPMSPAQGGLEMLLGLIPGGNLLGGIAKGIGKLFGGLFADGGIPPVGKISGFSEEGVELAFSGSRVAALSAGLRVPRSREFVLPAHLSRQLMSVATGGGAGGGGGGAAVLSVNYQHHGDVYDGADRQGVLRGVADAVTDLANRGGWGGRK